MQLFPLGVALRFLVTAHDRRESALPFQIPIGIAPVNGDVVDFHLLRPKTMHDGALHLFRHILPGGVLVATEMPRYRGEHLRIVVAVFKRGDATLGQAQRRVGHQKGFVDLFTTADTRAIGASPVRCVEAEIPRLQLIHGMPVLRTRKRQAEQMLADAKAALSSTGGAAGCALRLPIRSQNLHEHTPFGQLRRKLNRFGNAANRAFPQLDAIDDDFDEVLDLLVEGQRLPA